MFSWCSVKSTCLINEVMQRGATFGHSQHGKYYTSKGASQNLSQILIIMKYTLLSPLCGLKCTLSLGLKHITVVKTLK